MSFDSCQLAMLDNFFIWWKIGWDFGTFISLIWIWLLGSSAVWGAVVGLCDYTKLGCKKHWFGPFQKGTLPIPKSDLANRKGGEGNGKVQGSGSLGNAAGRWHESNEHFKKNMVVGSQSRFLKWNMLLDETLIPGCRKTSSGRLIWCWGFSVAARRLFDLKLAGFL